MKYTLYALFWAARVTILSAQNQLSITLNLYQCHNQASNLTISMKLASFHFLKSSHFMDIKWYQNQSDISTAASLFTLLL